MDTRRLNYYDFSGLLGATSQDSRRFVFERLYEFSKFPDGVYQLDLLIRLFKENDRLYILTLIQEQLPTLIKDGAAFIRILYALPRQDWPMFCNLLENKLTEIMYKEIFKMFIYPCTDPDWFDAMLSIYYKLPEMTTLDQFISVSRTGNPWFYTREDRINLFNTVGPMLGKWIVSADDFAKFFSYTNINMSLPSEYLTPYVCNLPLFNNAKDITRVIKTVQLPYLLTYFPEQIPQAIKNIYELADIFNEIPAADYHEQNRFAFYPQLEQLLISFIQRGDKATLDFARGFLSENENRIIQKYLATPFSAAGFFSSSNKLIDAEVLNPTSGVSALTKR